MSEYYPLPFYHAIPFSFSPCRTDELNVSVLACYPVLLKIARIMSTSCRSTDFSLTGYVKPLTDYLPFISFVQIPRAIIMPHPAVLFHPIPSHQLWRIISQTIPIVQRAGNHLAMAKSGTGPKMVNEFGGGCLQDLLN